MRMKTVIRFSDGYWSAALNENDTITHFYMTSQSLKKVLTNPVTERTAEEFSSIKKWVASNDTETSIEVPADMPYEAILAEYPELFI